MTDVPKDWRLNKGDIVVDATPGDEIAINMGDGQNIAVRMRSHSGTAYCHSWEQVLKHIYTVGRKRQDKVVIGFQTLIDIEKQNMKRVEEVARQIIERQVIKRVAKITAKNFISQTKQYGTVTGSFIGVGGTNK